MKNTLKTITIGILASCFSAVSLRASDEPQPAAAGGEPASHAGHMMAKDAKPYPLKNCLISGEDLKSMGKPFVMIAEGQELKFCCKHCVKDYENDKADYLKKLAEAEKKAKPYPLNTCLVSGHEFAQGQPYVFAYEGQQVKLCCKDCLTDFKKSPAKFMSQLDEGGQK